MFFRLKTEVILQFCNMKPKARLMGVLDGNEGIELLF